MYEGGRPFGSVSIYGYTEAQIRLHRIRSDQMYHHYLGDPLEVLLLYPGGGGEVKVVGSDLAAGIRRSCSSPGGTFTSHVCQREQFRVVRDYGVAGCETPNVEMGDRDKLIADYPGLRDEINEFTR